jgi:hypothetical protein
MEEHFPPNRDAGLNAMTLPTAATDEVRLVAALTDVLRQQRQTLLDRDPAGHLPTAQIGSGTAAGLLAPIWQPLLDELQVCAEHWQKQPAAASRASAELTARVNALRQEYEGLQHTLTVWSAAIEQAIAQSAQRPPEPVYGVAYGHASPQRQTLGRG